jgi:hypothetical protein
VAGHVHPFPFAFCTFKLGVSQSFQRSDGPSLEAGLDLRTSSGSGGRVLLPERHVGSQGWPAGPSGVSCQGFGGGLCRPSITGQVCIQSSLAFFGNFCPRIAQTVYSDYVRLVVAWVVHRLMLTKMMWRNLTLNISRPGRFEYECFPHRNSLPPS